MTSPLSLLAATCGSHVGQAISMPMTMPMPMPTTVKVISASPSTSLVSSVQLATNSQQLFPVNADLTNLLSGQTIGILNSDGTVTQINSSQVSVASSMANNIKAITSVAGQAVSLQQGTQIVTQASPGQQSISYSIIPQQQMQNIQSVQIDGQEAIFIPASSFSGGQQTIQISGNQILTSPNQTLVRGQNQANASNQQQQQQVLQSLGNNVQFAQIAGNGQVIRQGNGMQTFQMPQVQQTIPVQIPISTANGQTIYQTIQLPLSALQAVASGGNMQQITAQVMPQMTQQVQVAPQQMQVAQQGNGSNATQIKQEPGEQSNVSQQSSQNAAAQQQHNSQGQTVLANVQLPNGQMGQLVAASPQMWPQNSISLSSLSELRVFIEM